MLINNLLDRVSTSRSAIDAAIARVLDRGWLILGPEVKSFEEAFAAYIGVRYCSTVANGTDALEIALRALGVQAGDRVATAANAGMYATTALLAIGATPFYLDVEMSTNNVPLREVKRAIDAGVKAIVITHLYGVAAGDIAQIATTCRRNSVALVEDCAQAHGAKIEGQRVGSFGDAACFSFYPTKNLGALGDGGAIVTDLPDTAAFVSKLRQYGWTSKYTVGIAGARNSRMDEIQAAILSVLLKGLDAANGRRREISNRYSREISHPHVTVPSPCGDESVAHLYVVRTKHREALREHLRSKEISTEIHYPIPDHRQPVFDDRFASVSLPNTERLCKEIITLPCYPEMREEDVTRVVNSVNSWEL